MQTLDFSILYVTDAAASARFYEALLGRPPIEASPTFAMFAFGNQAMLGLWGRGGVEPAVTAPAGGSELAFVVGDAAAVDAAHAAWLSQGFVIGHAPKQLDFGYSAVALDPDGHRIRVMVPNGG